MQFVFPIASGVYKGRHIRVTKYVKTAAGLSTQCHCRQYRESARPTIYSPFTGRLQISPQAQAPDFLTVRRFQLPPPAALGPSLSPR